MPSKDRVVVTTTTFYSDPDGKDKVRFNLARELVGLAREDGHIVVIVDGSPALGVKEALLGEGARVVPQAEKGLSLIHI